MNPIVRFLLLCLLTMGAGYLASFSDRFAPPVYASASAPVYRYALVNMFPHDQRAFTQGLVYHNGFLYEGTGLRGESSLRKVELRTGIVLQLHELEPHFFGEGVTIFDNRIIQLTWQSNVGFVYDLESFIKLQEFYFPTEAWGLTEDGKRLIMSDGSATLYFLDPQSYQEIGRIEVRDDKQPVRNLNELEYVRGKIYANVLPTDRIAIIDPQNGMVTGWIDLTGLLTAREGRQSADILNGIAYDAENDRLFVTGKLWPKLFEIRIIQER